MVALVGTSGAGKTTLLQILGGLDKYDGGSVSVGGMSLDRLNSAGASGSGKRKAPFLRSCFDIRYWSRGPSDSLSGSELAYFRNRSIGFVFQFHHLLPDFTAVENVLIPGLIMGKGKAECQKRASDLLGIFDLSRRLNHYPTELSGGERQRVALARAMFNQPALVLADEPTGSLDRSNGERLLELFEKANKELGQTFLIATHNSRLSLGMNRVLYIEDGRIVSTDKPSTVADEW